MTNGIFELWTVPGTRQTFVAGYDNRFDGLNFIETDARGALVLDRSGLTIAEVAAARDEFRSDFPAAVRS